MMHKGKKKVKNGQTSNPPRPPKKKGKPTKKKRR